METIPEKRCPACKRIKPSSEYHHNRQRIDGIGWCCKDCQNQMNRERFHNDPEYASKKRKRNLAYQRANPEKKRERQKTWQQANPDKVLLQRQRSAEKSRERARQYYRDHSEQVCLRQQRYSKLPETREKNRLWQSRYRRKNPGKELVKLQRRRAREHNAVDTFTYSDWQVAISYFEGRCAVCGRPPGLWNKLSQDHWIPLARGGEHTPANIIPLCCGFGGCNNSKNSNLPHDWLIRKFGKAKARQIESRISAYFESVKSHQRK